ncbi:MAG: hypothetical protein ACR2N5_06635 [Solirubrobacterales bacterium]
MEAASASAGPLIRDGEIPAAPRLPQAAAPSASAIAIAGAVRCSSCARVPLIGEVVGIRRHRAETRWVCEPCARSSRKARKGDELGTQRVRSFGGALNVRRAA